MKKLSRAQDGASLGKSQLKKKVAQIVLAQGNIFIKDLLRSNNVSIGNTKAEFAKNLTDAIDAGVLTQAVIEAWLDEIEGWGNQHVYLFEPPSIARARVRPALEASKHVGLLDRKVSYEFPDTLTLSTIAFSGDHLSVAWHRSRGGWERAKSKDYRRDEGADTFEYRAYRERFDRSLVRFEWRPGDPYCAVMVQLPNEGEEHAQALSRVWQDLGDLGLARSPLTKIRLGSAFKRLSRKTDATVQSARLLTQGGHVELVSTLSEGGIDAVEAVRNVRRGVEDASFATADGMFSFTTEKYRQLSRTIKMEGYGLESRLRIWVQCKRDDVYTILSVIWSNNAP
ncbi:hypothetical protein [Bradyrhizobium embrapense]